MKIGPDASNDLRSDVREWESEGGATARTTQFALPHGITVTRHDKFHVGPYTYDRLNDALAEHSRQSSK